MPEAVLILLIVLGVILAVSLLLFLLCLVLMTPGKRRPGFPFDGAMIAHRGLHGQGVPENSLPAFKAAAARSDVGAELDVQLTKDGKLVVFHDATLKRVCGVDRSVTGTDYEELLQYPLMGTEERIPLFSEVLKALNGIPLICEIKVSPGADIPALCQAAWDELKGYGGPWCIESFHPAVVHWFKAHQPQVIRGQLSRNMFRSGENLSWPVKFILTHLLIDFYTRPDFIAYDFHHADTLGFRLVRALYCPYTAAWTPRGDEEVREAKGKGFDTLIFEEGK